MIARVEFFRVTMFMLRAVSISALRVTHLVSDAFLLEALHDVIAAAIAPDHPAKRDRHAEPRNRDRRRHRRPADRILKSLRQDALVLVRKILDLRDQIELRRADANDFKIRHHSSLMITI